jgi:hypothetical protein
MFEPAWARRFFAGSLLAAMAAAGCGSDSGTPPEDQPQYFLVAYTLESPDEGLSEAVAILRSGATHATSQPVTGASVSVNGRSLSAQAPGRYARSPVDLNAGESVTLDVVAGLLVHETDAVRPALPAVTAPVAGDTIPSTATSLVVTWIPAEDAASYICEILNTTTSERASVRTSSTTAGFPLGDLATPGATLRISVTSLDGSFSFDDPRFSSSVYDEPPYISGFAAMARTVLEVHRAP